MGYVRPVSFVVPVGHDRYGNDVAIAQPAGIGHFSTGTGKLSNGLRGGGGSQSE